MKSSDQSISEVFEIVARYMAWNQTSFDKYEYKIQHDRHVFTCNNFDGEGMTGSWSMTTEEMEKEMNGEDSYLDIDP